jgi:hypothetical protein
MNGMIAQSQSVIMKLNDMQDWDSMSQGCFSKKNIAFSLESTLKTIESMFQYKAKIKKIDIKISY